MRHMALLVNETYGTACKCGQLVRKLKQARIGQIRVLAYYQRLGSGATEFLFILGGLSFLILSLVGG